MTLSESTPDLDEPKKTCSNGSSLSQPDEKRIAGIGAMDEKGSLENGEEREYLWVEWEENDPGSSFLSLSQEGMK